VYLLVLQQVRAPAARGGRHVADGAMTTATGAVIELDAAASDWAAPATHAAGAVAAVRGDRLWRVLYTERARATDGLDGTAQLDQLVIT